MFDPKGQEKVSTVRVHQYFVCHQQKDSIKTIQTKLITLNPCR